ncbi:MAG: hypothetical protein PHQ05_03890 [Sterolibacterium sp.]|nr:hypothetical protein [Sterolibacterium sp.]
MSAYQAQSVVANAAIVVRRSLIATCTVENMAALALDDRGMIRDCNRASEVLFEYRRRELIWRHVSMLLPQLAELELMQNGQPNPRLRFLCRAGYRYQAVTQNGLRFASKLFFNHLDNAGQGGLSLIVRPTEEVSNCGE